MGKIKAFFRNKWVGFTLASILYILWFVLWTGNWWLLLGEIVIFDLYITRYFYKYVWRHNAEMCKKSKSYKAVYEWVNAIIFATVVASLVHIFFFQMYVIPSSSMEKSLLVGDYLYVSKVAYGPQMPNTPVAFPFVHHTMPFSKTKKSFSESVKWPYHRLKGLGRIKRNDVVVFNFPAGDTVLLERQDVSYYDVLRQYQQTFGHQAGRERLMQEYTVITRPVDKRENYIKRCIGLPGDSIRIEETAVYVNGKPQEPVAGKQFMYLVETTSPITQYALDNLGITEWSNKGTLYYMALTDENAAELEKLDNVASVQKYIARSPNFDVFPQDRRYAWNQDNYGPIWIPQAGTAVALTADNLPLYRRIIETYEGNDLRVDEEGKIFINGEQTATIRRTPASGDSFPKTTSSAKPPSSGCRWIPKRASPRTSAGTGCSPKSNKTRVVVTSDSYHTLAGPAEAIYKEKSSKFLAYAYPVESEEEIRTLLDALRKKYYDATHLCYAWRLGPHGETFRANDDGEPSGTAGKPILGQLLSNELVNCLIVVVRYFGGTKLGVSGLIGAYKESAAEAIRAAEIVERTVDTVVEVEFSYLAMNDVMRVVKEEQPRVLTQQFDNLCRMTLAIRQSLAGGMIGKLEKIGGVTLEMK